MAIRLNQQHAEYAMRREMEQNRMEQRENINRYFDHWEKVNTRYNNWTNPEYYEKADKQLQVKKDAINKERMLEVRRKKLRELFANEKAQYDVETAMKHRPRSREILADNKTLKKVSDHLKEREQLRRKLEVEAKIYSKWRHGVDDDHLLFKSKSTNEVLAKLHWLDNQIDEQMKREKEEALAHERNLRMQEELNRTEQMRKERQLIREQEIKEIRALQERHLEELKKRQEELETLKEEEKQLNIFLDELQREKTLLESSSALMMQNSNYSQASLKRIKLFIRKRSEEFRKQILLSINILERLRVYCTTPAIIDELLQKYKDDMENEQLSYTQIESMYESEAKAYLPNCEDTWRVSHLRRLSEMKELFDAEICKFKALLTENGVQQRENIETRTTHLATIENSNEKLKQLYKEQEDSSTGPAAIYGTESATSIRNESCVPLNTVPSRTSTCTSISSSARLPNLSNSFTRLNLDCWEKLPAVRGGIDSPRLQKTRTMNVVTPQNAEKPKFARKRIAWT